VTKAALLDAIWSEVTVSDSMPAICVAELRKALGDEAKIPRFIETVYDSGYRFVGKVTSALLWWRHANRRSWLELPNL
jgi:DNA-binding winged helix-turn-helix (wHTH) protein